ncbi:DUF4082 domain-containing protein [Micromonospora sp. WMMA1363]|uniref:DUF4082 domain-containing protein n=1 Tax=Micromonospora sp. WMMA1363 TaxID=3053985 RepID=UPI00259C7A8C|nr:DUF4082 domain-containing protein [Micromonospora sp. WMMA1363]MDM4722755.1 DUF4082 domain-containing protein [Micromonospora sp. WMMA1363]
MAEFAFIFGGPALPDLEDPGQDYTLAVDFATNLSLPCVGVQWRVPDTAPTGTCTAALWRVSDQVLLASKTFTVGVGGALLTVSFDAAVTVVAGTNYRAGVYTPNRYVATTNFDWPHTDDPLVAGADNGWLATELAFPGVESGNAANYHVSPVVDIPSGDGDGVGPRRVSRSAPGRDTSARTAGRHVHQTSLGRSP